MSKLASAARELIKALEELAERAELEEADNTVTYSPSTIEAAKHDSYRFKYVARENNDSIVLTLFENEPYEVDDRGLDVWIADYGIRCTIPYTEYPEVKPGQCVELREILGCEG